MDWPVPKDVRKLREFLLANYFRRFIQGYSSFAASFKSPGTRKLMPRWIGPYGIHKMAGPMAVKLSLPSEMRIHPVFHVHVATLQAGWP
jgi:hypothetical protein